MFARNRILRPGFVSLFMLLLALPAITHAVTHTVQVLDPRNFSPNDLTIEVGDTVRWVNASGGNRHDVTADDFSFRSVTASSFEFSRTFNSVEEIFYHCTVHSSPGRNIATSQNGRINVISSSTPAELAVQSVSAADGTYEPGDTFTVNASINNSGDDASGAFTITWYASLDSNISPADTSLGAQQIADVAGGATLNHQAMLNLPANMPDGSYFIGVIITFTDANAANNTGFDATPVTIKAFPDQSVSCDEEFVFAADNEFVINVIANGVDDTQNLQCAIDAAASTGMPVVRLASATYWISNVIATDFAGTLEGSSKAGTSLQILDGSIDCAAMEAAGRTPAAIKFENGEARIRRMTIISGAPCIAGSLQTVLHFSGESALADNCANDVSFGSVDRVDILGPGIAGLTKTAVSVHAEGNFLGGCKATLLGTFKLNRSLVSGFATGIVTAMKASAQVDINFNQFSDNLVAIKITDSRQNTTITNNTIDGDNTASTGYTGILAGTVSEAAPSNTRIVINNNTFNISATFATPSNAVLYDQQGNIANISTVISNNRFNLDGASAAAIVSTDVNKGHISANRFSGNALAGVMILADRTQVSGWTVTANTGFAALLSTSADVVFGTNTSNNILGAGQGATFTDLGVGNSILNLEDEITLKNIFEPELMAVVQLSNRDTQSTLVGNR